MVMPKPAAAGRRIQANPLRAKVTPSKRDARPGTPHEARAAADHTEFKQDASDQAR